MDIVSDEDIEQLIDNLIDIATSPESIEIEDNRYKKSGEAKALRENIEFLQNQKDKANNYNRETLLRVEGYDY